MCNAYSELIWLQYDIKDVSTKRQSANGTRIFLFRNGEEIGVFKSGYVRKMTNTSTPYQINKKYLAEYRYTILTDNGTKTIKSTKCSRELIYSELARMVYMIEWAKRNWNLRSLV